MKKTLFESWQGFQHFLWQTDSAQLPRGKAMVLVATRIVWRVIQDFAQGHLTLRAMSLVFTTLLSLVPMLALSFSVLKAFGVHNQLEPLLNNFLAPLGAKGNEISSQIVQFVENVNVGVLGSLGLLLLVYTVVSLIQKVEEALNLIWHVPRLRNLPQRLGGYLSVVMIGPLLLVTAMGITASVMSAALVQQLIAIEPFGSLFYGLSKLVPYLLVIGAFTGIYMIIPHTQVHFRSALIGGVVAGIMWESVSWGFAAFIASSGKYEAIYSGFAIVILFLFWLYINWLILLVGASIAFYHQNPAYLRPGNNHLELGQRSREALALEILRRIGLAHREDGPHWTQQALADAVQLPLLLVVSVMQKLIHNGLLLRTDDEPAQFVPGRDLDAIAIKDVIDVLREGDEESGDVQFADPTVLTIMHDLDDAIAHDLGTKTVKDLLPKIDKTE